MRFAPKRLTKTADVSRGDTSWQSFLRNALSVVIVFALGYLALGALAEVLARTVPDRWEARWFSPVPGIPSESAEFVRAGAILDRLLDRNGLRELPYRLVLIPDSSPNAFAFPGGAVGVTQGLLDSVETENGLAMVLGHELGHHQGRHPLKRIGRSLVFSVASSLLFGRGDAPVVDASLLVAESGYSRRQERQADALGLELVQETFGHTENCLEFFETIEREGGEARWAAFVRSHPLTSNRIDELRRLQAEMGGATTP